MANTLYRLKLAADDRLRTRQERLGTERAPAPENRIWGDTFSGRLEDRRPLCAYLGVEVPAQGFPHVNSTELFVEYNRAQLSRT